MPFLRLLVETVFVYNDKETPIPSVLTHHKILFSKLIIWSVSGFKDLKLVRSSENDLWDYHRSVIDHVTTVKTEIVFLNSALTLQLMWSPV